MNGFQFFFGSFSFSRQESTLTVIEQIPKLLQEAVYSVNTIGIPWLRLFYRAKEHFIHTQCICSITFYNHIRVHHVIHGLTHLFNCPTTDILAIFQNKLCIMIFRAPVLEGFHIQYIVRYNVYIYVQRSYFILVFQSQ